MTTLWWPGDHRAGPAMSDRALLAAMVSVEHAWLRCLVDAAVAPASAGAAPWPDPAAEPAVLASLAVEAERGGNPVIGLVRLLRERLPEPAATWVHRGLTSQDVLDTALVLCARDAVAAVRAEVADQVAVLVDLVERHRGTPMVARTLTQPAVPTTFGAKAATWLHGVLDADELLAALALPVQLGGAGGTLASLVELAGADGARSLRRSLAPALGLEQPSAPWHTRRTPVTRLADAAVTASDAWGRVANDVLALGRPEVGELRDGSAGGSSAMPQKANPTLAVLVRRAALAGPQQAAALHLAAAEQVDERADGGWHLEWHTIAVLLRRTVVAASHTSDLLRGLSVRTDRMAARLAEVEHDVRAEQRSLAGLTGREPLASYDGLVGDLVDEALARAAEHPRPRGDRS
ncbi:MULTISPECIES: lyase family protein [unclassified Nocardioides]|uniref:lyase family protein n=1 Tax=unclassified Nocardioides TaxID=2615069 RepID=UPI0026660803|nr:lyase family protein [Nocardioides sp. Arc9.136]WKN47033.1 lyase family protein [Nocardioides sp. Arc9.136]